MSDIERGNRLLAAVSDAILAFWQSGATDPESEMREWWLSDDAIDVAWEMAGAISDRLDERGFKVRRSDEDLGPEVVRLTAERDRYREAIADVIAKCEGEAAVWSGIGAGPTALRLAATWLRAALDGEDNRE